MSSLSTKLKNLKDYRCVMEPEVKDQIIVEYAPLVKFIAQKIASRLPSNIELDDLISCGVIGLMDAIQKFDPSRDNKFKTTSNVSDKGLWLPSSVNLKDNEINLISNRIKYFFKEKLNNFKVSTKKRTR